MQSRFDAALARWKDTRRSMAAGSGRWDSASAARSCSTWRAFGTDLKGVAAFHAGLGAAGAPAQSGKVKAKLLVQNGAADPFHQSPRPSRRSKKEMDAAKVDYRYISYPGAVHAFTNPEATALGRKFDIPIAYNAEADRKSMAEATSFFAGVFK